MNWLGQLLGSDWEIFPAGGATGDAYYAKHNGQQLFLKRNSSPFFSCFIRRRHCSEAGLDKTDGKWGRHYGPALDDRQRAEA